MTPAGSIKDFVRLSKLNIMIPVSITGFTGYFIYRPHLSLFLFLVTAGILMLAVSASVINQVQEADIDAIMPRTCNRPIPAGRITRAGAVVYSVFMLLTGLLLLFFFGNLSAAIAGLVTIIVYNSIYTPLKRKTAFAVVPGALTGALPPLIGWVAAGGTLHDRNIILIGFLLFMGQIPHFWLLVVRYGDEYRAAGLPALTGIFSNIQIRRLIFTWVLTTVAAALFLGFFDIIRLRLMAIILLAVSVFLVWRFSRLMKKSVKIETIPEYSILLNTYFLLIMILLIADRIVL